MDATTDPPLDLIITAANLAINGDTPVEVKLSTGHPKNSITSTRRDTIAVTSIPADLVATGSIISDINNTLAPASAAIMPSLYDNNGTMGSQADDTAEANVQPGVSQSAASASIVPKILMEQNLSEPPTFDNLPTEMVANILDLSHIHDLPALRLACKLTNVSATKRFARTHFRLLKILVSQQGLQSLIKICNHPAFGSAIRTVALSSFRLLEQSLDYCTVAHLSNDNLSSTPQDARTRTRHYARRLDEQQAIQESGKAQDLLTQAFSILETYGNRIRIGVNDDYSLNTAHSCHGNEAFFEGDVYSDYGEYCRDKCLKLLLNAAFRSGCKVDSVSILESEGRDDMQLQLENEKSENGDLIISEISHFGLDTDAALTVLSELRNFTFTINEGDGNTSPRLSANTVESIDYMISLSPHLEKVELKFDFDFISCRDPELLVGRENRKVYEAFDKISASLTSDKLHNLRLEYLVGNEASFLNLLDKHKKTLRFVALRSCILRLHGVWARILMWMLDNLVMEGLCLEILVVESEPFKHAGIFGHGIKLSGNTVEEWRKALTDAVAELQEESGGPSTDL